MKETLINITSIKIFAILLVVFRHSSIIYSGEWFITASVKSNIFLNIFKLIHTFHMPLFVFVSGYLFYYSIKESRIDHGFIFFAKKKALRLMVPYFAVALLWMIPIRLAIHFYEQPTFNNIIFRGIILSKDTGSLWFLMMLFNVSLIFYLINKFLNILNEFKFINKQAIELTLLGLLLMIHLTHARIPLIDIRIPNYFQISTTLYYMIYFYIGYLYREKSIKIESFTRYHSLHCFSACTIYIILFSYTQSASFSNASVYIRELAKLSLAASAIHGIYYISLITQNFSKKICSSSIYRALSKHNYSIYLLHAPVIYIITFQFYRDQIAPICIVSSCFFSSIIVSLLISHAISKNSILKPLLGLT